MSERARVLAPIGERKKIGKTESFESPISRSVYLYYKSSLLLLLKDWTLWDL